MKLRKKKLTEGERLTDEMELREEHDVITEGWMEKKGKRGR